MGTIRTSPSRAGRQAGGQSSQALLELLVKHPDDNIGWEAAETLVRRNDARVIAPLCEIVRRTGAPGRQHAARLLGELRAVPAVPCLAQLLADDRNRYVRVIAARSLGQIGGRDAVAALIENLRDEESCVRAVVAECLGEIGDPAAAAALTAAAEDENGLVRTKVAAALAALRPGSAPAPDTTIEWSLGQDTETPAPTGNTDQTHSPPTPELEETPSDRLLRVLTEGECVERLAAAETLAADDEKRAIEPMIRSFLGCDDDYRDRVAALLAGMGRVAGIALGQALDDPEPDIRAGAAAAIAVRGEEAVDCSRRLAKMLFDPSPSVRRAAAEALGAIGWRPRSPATEAARLFALGRWEGETAQRLMDQHGAAVARAFIAALRFDDDASRRAAAGMLVRLGAAAVGPLLRGLKDPDSRVRELSVGALGELRAVEAEADIESALGDENPGVREAALVALARLGAGAALNRLLPLLADPVDYVRVAAVEVVSQLGDGRAADAIIGRLEDESPDVRRVAAETLNRLRDPRAIRPLLRLLEDPDHGVRYAAEAAIGTLEQV